jgi:hypothetical protein
MRETVFLSLSLPALDEGRTKAAHSTVLGAEYVPSYQQTFPLGQAIILFGIL